jgi:glycosyltransferase involved in cell wall biosynthesis
MAGAPQVSVALPVFNGGAFLVPALDSILGQTFADFELIAIDDGSTDNSPALLDAYAARDSRVRVIHQANAGVVASLNRGIELARGRYIARMDADDVAHPERFARQVNFLDVNPRVAAVGSAITLIDERGERIREVDYPETPKDVATFLKRGCALAHPSVMMRRDAVAAMGGYRPAFQHAEDYDLWLRLAERHDLANLPERLLLYRQHQTKVSARNRAQQMLSTRMAQLASVQRRSGEDDPGSGLTQPSFGALRDLGDPIFPHLHFAVAYWLTKRGHYLAAGRWTAYVSLAGPELFLRRIHDLFSRRRHVKA